MRLVPLILVLLAVFAPSAGAAGWSRPFLLQSERCDVGFCSPAPAAAINRHGTVVALYRRESDLRNLVRLGDASGRFGAPQVLPKGAYPGRAAIADDGTAVIAWARNGEVRATFRHPGGRFGHSILVARLKGSEAAIDDVAVGLDATGRAGVVAWSDFQRRKLTTAGVRAIDARAGRTVGHSRIVDSGQFLRLGDLAVNRAGAAALTWLVDDGFQQGSRIGVITRGPAGFSDPLRLSAPDESVADPRAAIDPSGAVAVAYTAVSVSGDAGARGIATLRVRPAGAATFAPELKISTAHPNRVFNPAVAFSGDGRATLLYQEKTHEAGFSRAAPLHAAVASADGATLGAPATVGKGELTQPRLATLDGGRLLAIWQTAERPDAPLAAALSGAGSAFRATAAPAGRADPFSDASGNRALAAAGRYAVCMWGGGQRTGFLRISVRRF